MIDIRRFPLDTQRVRNAGLQALLVLGTLVAVAALYDRPLALPALAVGFGALVAVAVDRRLVIPIVVLLLPLEIGSRYIPVYHTAGSAKMGASAISLARMGIVLGGLLWAARAPTEWWRELPRSSLYLPLSLLSALYVFSLAGTENVSGAVEEIGRLLFHISFFVLIAIYVRDRQTLRWTLMALVASGLVLALIGIYQQVTDTYLWNEALALRGVRRNATFVDPNIYARFLVVTMVMAMALFFGDRSRFRYVLLATFDLAALALPFTSSRSNWLAAAVLLPAVAAALPMNAWRKTKLIALGGAVGVALALVVAHLEPAVADRFQSLGDGTDSLGVRRDLVRAGWQMFLDNPVFGVGLDAFEANLRGPYRHLLPPDASTFLSHASLITIMAELGSAGLAVLALLFYRFGRICWRIYSAATAVDKATVVGLAGACMAIFLSSQSEGRFFEEPYLWLTLGLAVALAGIRDREAEGGREERGGSEGD